MSDIDNTARTNAMIVALEALNLPPLPAEVRTMIDENQPHLTKLLRALADELERPGAGMPVIDLMPPSARALGVRLHSEPSLMQAGLLDTLKRTQALDERTMVPDSQLN